MHFSRFFMKLRRLTFLGLILFLSQGCGVNLGEKWGYVGSTDISTGAAGFESLGFGKNNLYLAYQDGAHGQRVSVKKFDGTSWNSVGPENISPDGIATNLSLFVDPDDGTPYVAYVMSTTGFIRKANSAIPLMTVSNKTFVEKYDGKKWVLLGGGPMGKGNLPSIFIRKGVPYVSFFADEVGLEVEKFNGKSWETLGEKSLSTHGIPYTWRGLFVDESDRVYVGFQDERTKQAFVSEYDGGAWVTVGKGPASGGIAVNGSLTVDNGSVYLAFLDAERGNRATLMSCGYNGVWVSMGKKGFTAGRANSLSLAVYRGVPYLAYQDESQSNKATVMGFSQGSWEPLGNAGFSLGPAFHESLVVVPDKSSFFIAFRDAGHDNKALVMGTHLLDRK